MRRCPKLEKRFTVLHTKRTKKKNHLFSSLSTSAPFPSLSGSSDVNDMWWLDDKTGCEPEGGVVGCDIENASVTYTDFSLTYVDGT